MSHSIHSSFTCYNYDLYTLYYYELIFDISMKTIMMIIVAYTD